MHCQKCHKNFASIRYAEVVDGEVIDQHLCRACLDEKQNAEHTGFEFSSPSPFIRKGRDSARHATTQHRGGSCSACNTDLTSIFETGEVGCCQCYKSLSTEIDMLMKDIHRDSLIHTGKVPRQDNLRAKTRADLQTKRALLKTSLSAERYEEAAVLRDEIKSLEAGLNTMIQKVE